MTNADQEIGFMRGQQVAMQKELVEIKTDVKEVRARLDAQDRMLSQINGKLDGIITTQTATNKHPVTTVTTQIETDGESASVRASVVTRVLKLPFLPWLVCLVLVMVMAVYCFSVLSGRPVSSFMPASQPAPASP